MTKYLIRTSYADADVVIGGCLILSLDKFAPWCVPSVIGDHKIHADPECAAFIKQNSNEKTTSGDPKWGAVKWFHKVAALTMRPWPEAEWMIWLDADVELTARLTPGMLDELCDGYDVVFLGRPWAYASETGFLALRLATPGVKALLNLMRNRYLTGAVFEDDNWGDARCFDRCRKRIPSLRCNDLTGHMDPSTIEQDGMHVWPSSPLGAWSVHHKGPKRKAEAYGAREDQPS